MPVRPLPWDPVAAAEQQWRDHGWEAAAASMAAITSVLRAHRLYQARVEAVLKPTGLNASRYEVLTLLYFSRNSALPLGVISDRLQLQPATITNTVDKLQSAGLVERAANPADRRGTLAILTARGRRVTRKASALMNAEIFEPIDVPADELRQLTELVGLLRESLGRQIEDNGAGPRPEAPALRTP